MRRFRLLSNQKRRTNEGPGAVYGLRACQISRNGRPPYGAACVRRSLDAGTPVHVPGPHRTVMAGLRCGEVSLAAWPHLLDGVAAAVEVDDEPVGDARRLLHDAGIPAGESGAAGLAGALALRDADPDGAAAIGLVPAARVLLLATEGATDA